MLYVVATPIGNLDDITFRALETLKNTDLIAAEDTRRTLGLLEHFGIKKPLVSYFEHNKFMRGEELLDKLRAGANVALVSDAGMPGISDPGYELIRDARAAGIDVTVIPGACACVTALVLSGLPTDGFVFEGFIGTENKQRRACFDRLLKEQRTVVCYEAPHRIEKTLAELNKLFCDAGTPERRIAVCRELTKTHEEVLTDTAAALIKHFEAETPRGEFVLCIEGAAGDAAREFAGGKYAGGQAGFGGAYNGPGRGDNVSEDELRAFYAEQIDRGVFPKDAMKALRDKYGISRNEAYRIVKISDE